MARHPMKPKLEEEKPARREWCLDRAGVLSFGIPSCQERVLNATEAKEARGLK